MSSGSLSSDVEVNPTRSEKSTDTTLRCSSEGSAGPTAAPQEEQNLASAGRRCPHCEQIDPSGSPHPEQKPASSGLDAPQRPQAAMARSCQPGLDPLPALQEPRGRPLGPRTPRRLGVDPPPATERWWSRTARWSASSGHRVARPSFNVDSDGPGSSAARPSRSTDPHPPGAPERNDPPPVASPRGRCRGAPP